MHLDRWTAETASTASYPALHYGSYPNNKNPNNPLQPGDLKNRIAEAHFLRAYFHFLPARSYGDIVYMDYVADLSGDVNFVRQSWPDVLVKLLADLDFAIAELPVRHLDIEFGRVDKGSALALKAIVLYMNASPMYNGGKFPGSDTRAGKASYSTYDNEKWKLAADAAKAVMDLQNNGIPRFSLYQGKSNDFHEDWKRSGNWPLHFPMIRLPEIQLIYCEAMNQFSGPSSEIYDVLNNLRARSFMAPVPPGLDKVALLKYIQRELRIEHFYENKRYFYARWNLEPDSPAELAQEAAAKASFTPELVWPYAKTQRTAHGMKPKSDSYLSERLLFYLIGHSNCANQHQCSQYKILHQLNHQPGNHSND